MLQSCHQDMLRSFIGLDHLVAERLNRRTCLALLLAVLNHKHWEPCHRATVIIKLLARVGVGSTNFHKPRTFKLSAWIEPVQRAIWFWFQLHRQSFVAMMTSTYCTAKVIALDVAEPETVWVCEPPPPVAVDAWNPPSCD